MKILKYLLFGLVGITILLLVIALFIPREYTVSVSIIINKPKQEVFDYVKLVKNQEQYSIWVMQDLGSLSYTGTDGTVGFLQAWNSKKDDVGEGEQQITRIIDGERIDAALRFKRPFEGNATAATILKTINKTQTQITSEFHEDTSYPMNLISLFSKSMIEKGEIQILQNLKNILEK